MLDEVLTFWFGADPKRWFMRDAAFDTEIRDRFGALHAEAAAGGLEGWRATTKGTLALILVLDQFSRNLYREDARAFAQDARARALSEDLLASGRMGELLVVERMFALLPLEHTEDREVQHRCVAEFEALAAEVGPVGMMAVAVEYAKKHAEIIDRFGRFPHRNTMLGRESTPEELAFLEQPGSRF